MDTNVLLVAEDGHETKNNEYAIKVGVIVGSLVGHKSIMMDRKRLILTEYMRAFEKKKTSGIGTKFLKDLLSRLMTPYCEWIDITPTDNSNSDFHEIPRASGYDKFDKDDKKFLAISYADKKRPLILNCVDSDWIDFEKIHQAEKISVWNIE